jgi:hypothetical protein
MHIDSGTIAIILGVLLGISEALASVPVIQSNSIFQLIQNILKALVKKPSV